MKCLLLMRHAKSSWKHPGLADHDRPLNRRGQRDAPRMGRLIGQEGLVPDLILTSTARRALDTARAVRDQLPAPCPLEERSDLYHASPRTILDTAASAPDDIRTLLIVGHNPGMEQVVEAVGAQPQRMPTGALALIHTASWEALGSGASSSDLMNVWLPREFVD